MADRPARKGRPRLSGSVCYLRLRSSVFELWKKRKQSLGYSRTTHSVFAEYLLHQMDHQLSSQPERDGRQEASEAVDSRTPQFASTPIRHQQRRVLPDFLDSEIEVLNSDVDVTGTSSCDMLPLDADEPLLSVLDRSVGGMQTTFNTLPGNPFSSLQDDDCNLSERSGSDEAESDDNFWSIEDDVFHLGNRLQSILEDLGKSDDDDGDDDDSDDNGVDDDGADGDVYENVGEIGRTVHSTLMEPVDMEVSVIDEEATLTMVEDFHTESDADEDYPAARNLEVPTTSSRVSDVPAVSVEELHVTQTDVPDPPMESASENADKSVAGNKETIMKSLETAFSALTNTDSLEDLVALHSRLRVVVSIEKLVELLGSSCRHKVNESICGASLTHSTTNVGSRVDIKWRCGKGHYGKWESSEIITTNHTSKVYLNDSMIPIAIVLSGNNYAKFELFCKALNLCTISKTSFLNFQRNCAIPVVKDVWAQMQKLVLQILSHYEQICLCGDGRNDSPGHSARYCVYTLMEHITNVVVDLEVLDKRETGGNSTTMEKEGLRRLLHRLMDKLPFDEICTDASSTIIKLIRDMKASFPVLLELFHSLDIWHKAKKLTKALHKAARIKGCEAMKEWIDPIVNHFWYCCQMADGSVEELKERWQGVLHHVCGEHSWAESSCQHGPHVETENTKTPLAKSSKAMAALRKIILDKKWLQNLHFYVRFRHTGYLENFNSMMTKYAPKRMAFEYPYFIMRILLAAIDHNMHLFRGPKIRKDGQQAGHRKFSKRTDRYHAEVVKKEKQYSYFPYMSARMLLVRKGFEGSFSSRSDVDEFNPKQIAPTLGMKEPPPTEELIKALSRFAMKTKENENK